MILEEYDEAKHIENEKKISYEDGYEDGKQSLIKNALKQGKSCEEVASFLDISIEAVLEATGQQSEATALILEKYDKAKHIENEKKISYEDGYEDGVQNGIGQGIEQNKQQVYERCIARGMREEDAKAISGLAD